ncbi:MAG: 50S ribosomal protein L3 [bacterium]|nr:50S ribosomal protein L3 [bacterium]
MCTAEINDRAMGVTRLIPVESSLTKPAPGGVLVGLQPVTAGLVPKPQRIEQGMTADRAYRKTRTVRQFLDQSSLKEGTYKVTLTSIGRGKGFQGCVRRHGFSQQPKTHGGRARRRPGSIGAIRGKVVKGKAMPGRMGRRRVTQRVRLVKEGESL